MDEHAGDFAGREEHQGTKMANRELNLTVAYAPPSEPLAAMHPSFSRLISRLHLDVTR
jgi:hypothetical protein